MTLALLAIAPSCEKGDAPGSAPPAVSPSVDTSSASDVLGPAGGAVVHRSGAKIVVPPGALSAATTITLTGIAAAPAGGAFDGAPLGQAYAAGPEGQVFLRPVEVTVPFDPTRLRAGATAQDAQIFAAARGSASAVALQSTADLAARTVRASTLHLGELVAASSSRPLLVSSPPTLPDGVVGEAYGAALTARGGAPPYTWQASACCALPAGLSLSASGSLSGTPASDGAPSFSIVARDSQSRGVELALSMNVRPSKNPTPVLAEASPASIVAGAAATAVTLTGGGFVASSQATWDGAPLPTSYVGGATLSATLAPALLAAPGAHAIAVVSPPPGGGASAAVTFTVTAVASHPVPAVTSVDPGTLSVSTGDTPLRVHGSGFVPESLVVVGISAPRALATTYVSSTDLDASMPASLLTSPGTLEIGVSSPPPGGGSSPTTVSVVVVAANPIPTLSALSPASAAAGDGAFDLDVTGTGFVQGGAVFFGGTSLTTQVLGDTHARASVPASLVATAGSAPVVFMNPSPGGGASGSLAFTVTSPPDGGPPEAGTGGPWVSVTTGNSHACAVARDGTVSCWGSNLYGELGNRGPVCPAPPASSSPYPLQVPGVASALAVTAGYSHSCALLDGGTVKCWGADDARQLGVAPSDPACSSQSTATDVPGVTGVVAIAAGHSHTCALHGDGGVTCWGANAQGQLGRGTSTGTAAPARVSGLGGAATSISVVGDSSCARLATGALQCWGEGPPGLFGNPAIVSSAVPYTLQGFGPSTSIATGSSDVCVVTPAGTLRCMGDTQFDQLGAVDGGVLHQVTTPVDVPGVSGLADVVVNDTYLCGRSLAGAVSCWGRTPSRDGSTIPALVAGLETGIHQVAVPQFARFGCAVSDTGILSCWGDNPYNVLGNDTVSFRPDAEPIPNAPPPPPDAGPDADAGTDADAAPACTPPASAPPPACGPYPSAIPNVYAYAVGANSRITVSNTYAAGGGNSAYAIRYPCADSPDLACTNQGTFSFDFSPGAGTVYVVGYGSFVPPVTVTEITPPASNTTCAGALPILANQAFAEPDVVDGLPRYYKVTVPKDRAYAYAQAYVDVGGVNIQLLATCGGPVLASAVSQATLPIQATTDVLSLYAGDYILVANASAGSKLTVRVQAN